MRRWVLIFLCHASSAVAGTEFLKHPNWNTYLVVINLYHRTSPGTFKALELLPLDEIPQKLFHEEITSTTDEWLQYQSKRKGTLADRQREISMSREANSRLYDLIAGTKSKYLVAIKAVVDSLPESMRLAMTPVDELFLNGVMAKKIKEDLETKGIRLNQIQRVVIEPKAGSLKYSISDSSAVRYDLKLVEKTTSSLVLKSSFKEKRGLATPVDRPDAILPVYDLKGSFYERKDDDLPFGRFPVKTEQYIAEDGAKHFFGDGHKH